jgi:hypothetical protein
MSEADVVKAILEGITVRGGKALRANSGAQVMEKPDGTTRLFRAMAKGTSDILACYKGRFLAIEAKWGKNTTSVAQDVFLEDVARAGGIALVAYSWDYVSTVLDRIDRREL